MSLTFLPHDVEGPQLIALSGPATAASWADLARRFAFEVRAVVMVRGHGPGVQSVLERAGDELAAAGVGVGPDCGVGLFVGPPKTPRVDERGAVRLDVVLGPDMAAEEGESLYREVLRLVYLAAGSPAVVVYGTGDTVAPAVVLAERDML